MVGSYLKEKVIQLKEKHKIIGEKITQTDTTEVVEAKADNGTGSCTVDNQNRLEHQSDMVNHTDDNGIEAEWVQSRKKEQDKLVHQDLVAEVANALIVDAEYVHENIVTVQETDVDGNDVGRESTLMLSANKKGKEHVIRDGVKTSGNVGIKDAVNKNLVKVQEADGGGNDVNMESTLTVSANTNGKEHVRTSGTVGSKNPDDVSFQNGVKGVVEEKTDEGQISQVDLVLEEKAAGTNLGYITQYKDERIRSESLGEKQIQVQREKANIDTMASQARGSSRSDKLCSQIEKL